MKVRFIWKGDEGWSAPIKVQDVAMSPNCLILRISSDVDRLVPYASFDSAEVDKETPCVVVPGSGRAA